MLPGSQQQAPWHWHLCWTAVPEQAYADMQCDAFDCTLCAVPAKAYTPITIKFQDCMSTVITACLVERHVYDQGMLQGNAKCVSLVDLYLEAALWRKSQCFMSEIMSILRYEAKNAVNFSR